MAERRQCGAAYAWYCIARCSDTTKIIEMALAEEGRKPESVFDFVQGITALARGKTQQDARLDLEGRARKLLDLAA